MDNTIFLVLGEKSAYHSSFSLADALVKKGYDVCYLVFGMEGMLIRNNGFRYHLIHAKEKRRKIGSVGGFARYYHLHQYVVNRKVEKLIVREKPCLCILNALNMPLAVQFLKYKVPIVNYVNEFVSNITPDLPPVFSSLMPHSKGYNQVLNRLAWFRVYSLWVLRKARFSFHTYMLKRKYSFDDVYDQVRKYGEHYEFFEYGYRLKGHDYFCYPEALDISGRRHSSSFVFGGSHVYAQRNDGGSFRLEANRGQKVVYCSLGTWSVRHLKKSLRKRFYLQLLKVFQEDHSLYLVLSVPKEDHFDELFPLPSNVQLHHYVPQIDVLERSDVFITHGGVSSVREAMYAGVPMIVLPGVMDQPGNAARVLHYGVGLRGRLKSITSDKLSEMIHRISSDKKVRQSVSAYKKVFRDEYSCIKGVAFIEGIINSQHKEHKVTEPEPGQKAHENQIANNEIQ